MITEGTEVYTVGRFGSKCANFKSGGISFSMPVWSAKKYVAKKNYNGELKWFLVCCFGRTVASKYPSKKLCTEVLEAYGSSYVNWCGHAQKVVQPNLTP